MDKRPAPLNFLPLPVEIPIRHRDPSAQWSAAIAQGLIIENAPPHRLIRHDDRVVGQYALGDDLQERFMLLRMVELNWISAGQLADHWGLHRNTLGNWAWRLRFFGLDGLVRDRLPGSRKKLKEILRAGLGVVPRRPDRGLSLAELDRALAATGYAGLPRTALGHLQGMLSNPQERAVMEAAVTEDRNKGDEPPDDGGDSCAPGAGHAPGQPEQPAAHTGAQTRQATALGLWGSPVREVLASPPAGSTASQPDAGVRAAPAAEGALDVVEAVAAEVVAEGPPPPSATDVPMRQAGLALALPAAQDLLEPLQPFLERQWGNPLWYYRPLQMVFAFVFYVLASYLNPEQVKAAPAPDFGPLLGRRRAPACITLRRRLPAFARSLALVDDLQRRIAERYLRLGWVVPDWWLLDGHFCPYFGQETWGKGWWPQRRMPQPGFFQDWLHDRRGRPFWLHVTQGFELFADHIPLVADSLLALLAAAGQRESVLLVFDRGGYNAEVFRGLNARGVGWVTWLKGKVALPPAAFTETGKLPSATPGQPPRAVHYALYTHQVQGCHGHVAAIAWHHGDPAHQVALLHNTDNCQPGRWSALDLIGALDGRWAQENGFKGMVEHVDLDWTNGYAHQSCAATPVPNPQGRALRRRLGELTDRLRRAMDKPTPRRPAAAAKHRRRLGTLQGQITRLTRRLEHLPATVPYGSLGRAATSQLQPARGTLFPVLRAVAHHLRLQLRDHIAAVFPDHREHDKVLRVLLASPGRYVRAAAGDFIVLQRPALPRYAAALQAVIVRLNAQPPHAPDRPGHPLRFALEN